jgi:hypothetical protein
MSKRKQIPLRLSPKLYEEIAAWAAEDFRSVNGQIEYLLTLCVQQRKKTGRYTPDVLTDQQGPERWLQKKSAAERSLRAPLCCSAEELAVLPERLSNSTDIGKRTSASFIPDRSGWGA